MSTWGNGFVERNNSRINEVVFAYIQTLLIVYLRFNCGKFYILRKRTLTLETVSSFFLFCSLRIIHNLTEIAGVDTRKRYCQFFMTILVSYHCS